VSGKGISWAICKSAPRFRQITMPVPHHSVFYRPDALPAAQPTASKQKISPSPGRDWQANINAQSTHGCISRRISYLSYTQNSILYDTSRSCDGTGLLWQVATLLRELTCHTGYTVLPATRRIQVTFPPLPPAEAGTRLSDPGGMQG